MTPLRTQMSFLLSLQQHQLPKGELCPPSSYVEALTTETLECDCHLEAESLKR